MLTKDRSQPAAFWDYLELCKPKVVALMLLTALIGIYLAQPGFVPLSLQLFALTGIGLCAGSAACVNHLVDQRIDAIMARTQKRPVASGKISTREGCYFAALLGLSGLCILIMQVNTLTAVLTFITLMGYAGIYTGFLKRTTPQNIVIGGLAGAAPPLLGWTAVTNHLDAQALLLVLIIFTWTPPHFWALAIYRIDDYRKAEIPMLPVTHGIAFTKLYILLYTILLLVVSIFPFITGMSGMLYLIAAMVAGGRYLYWSIILFRNEKPLIAMKSFRFSIIYLLVLFVFLLIDHYAKGFICL